MAQNPVEQRLADLARDWLIFRDDDPASLLIWQVADNARRLVAAFFESQKYASDYATGDLFIDFDTPFEYALQYSRDLKIFLAESYAASVDALRQQGESVNWAFDPTAFPDSPEGFVRAVGSFIAHYGDGSARWSSCCNPKAAWIAPVSPSGCNACSPPIPHVACASCSSTRATRRG
jgi:hypothetical protein